MDIEEALQNMRSDKSVIYKNKKWYILFMDSLNGYCTISTYPLSTEMIGDVVKNVSVYELSSPLRQKMIS